MKHYASHNKRLKNLVGKFENLPQENNVFDFTMSEALLISDYYENEKLPNLALEVLDLSIEHFDRPSKFQIKKTRLLINQSSHKIASNLLKEDNIKGLKDSQVELLQLEIFISQSKIQEAFSLIKALKVKYEKTRKILSDIYYMESLAYDKIYDYKNSFSALNRSLCIYPNHPDALGKIWITTELSRQSKQSIKLHEYLIAYNHYSSIKWFNIGHAYYAEAKYEKALEAFEFAIIINEDFESAYLDLADVALQLRLYKKAKEHLEIAYNKFDIKELEVVIPYGECLLECGEVKKALEVLNECNSIVGKDPQVSFLLGEAYRKDGKIKKAIQNYKCAINLGLDRDDAFYQMGLIFADSFDYFKAEECFKEAIDLNEHFDAYRSTLASLYYNIGEVVMAESVLSKALQDIPSVKLEYHYGALLYANGKKERGLAVLAKALEDNSELYLEIFEFVQELQNDKSILAIIEYYC